MPRPPFPTRPCAINLSRGAQDKAKPMPPPPSAPCHSPRSSSMAHTPVQAESQLLPAEHGSRIYSGPPHMADTPPLPWPRATQSRPRQPQALPLRPSTPASSASPSGSPIPSISTSASLRDRLRRLCHQIFLWPELSPFSVSFSVSLSFHFVL